MPKKAKRSTSNVDRRAAKTRTAARKPLKPAPRATSDTPSKKSKGRKATSDRVGKGGGVPRGTPPPSHHHQHKIELIARALLTHRGQVLLCRNLKHGYLYLPGGHVEFAEPAAAAAARELLEECGLRARVGPLLLVTEGRFSTKKRLHHEINLVFHVEHPPTPELENVRSLEPEIGIEWVDLAALVDLDIRPAAVKAYLIAGPQTAPTAAEPPIEWYSDMPA